MVFITIPNNHPHDPDNDDTCSPWILVSLFFVGVFAYLKSR